jgi:heme exporter protein D
VNLAWSNWSEFFAMGGYGLYVWGSCGVTAAVMLLEVLALRAKRRSLQQEALDPTSFEGSTNET